MFVFINISNFTFLYVFGLNFKMLFLLSREDRRIFMRTYFY